MFCFTIIRYKNVSPYFVAFEGCLRHHHHGSLLDPGDPTPGRHLPPPRRPLPAAWCPGLWRCLQELPQGHQLPVRRRAHRRGGRRALDGPPEVCSGRASSDGLQAKMVRRDFLFFRLQILYWICWKDWIACNYRSSKKRSPSQFCSYSLKTWYFAFRNKWESWLALHHSDIS